MDHGSTWLGDCERTTGAAGFATEASRFGSEVAARSSETVEVVHLLLVELLLLVLLLLARDNILRLSFQLVIGEIYKDDLASWKLLVRCGRLVVS